MAIWLCLHCKDFPSLAAPMTHKEARRNFPKAKTPTFCIKWPMGTGNPSRFYCIVPLIQNIVYGITIPVGLFSHAVYVTMPWLVSETRQTWLLFLSIRGIRTLPC